MALILSGTDGVSDVDGTAATPAVRGSDANTGIFFPAADTIGFAEGGVEVARITSTSAWSFGASGTATGTSGQVLTSAGSGAAPAWASATLPSGSSISNPVINDGYTEETFVANTGTAFTINLANGSVQYLTLTGNCTYTFPTPVAGQSFMLIQRQDGTGSRSVTWPATVDWPGATAPTLTATANRADKFVFTAIDGSNWLGSNAGQNYTV